MRGPGAGLPPASGPQPNRLHQMAAERRRRLKVTQQVDDTLGQHMALIAAAVSCTQQGGRSARGHGIFAAISCMLAQLSLGPDLLARHAVLGAVAAVLISSATAAACEGLRDGPKGTVTEIVDG